MSKSSHHAAPQCQIAANHVCTVTEALLLLTEMCAINISSLALQAENHIRALQAAAYETMLSIILMCCRLAWSSMPSRPRCTCTYCRKLTHPLQTSARRCCR